MTAKRTTTTMENSVFQCDGWSDDNLSIVPDLPLSLIIQGLSLDDRESLVLVNKRFSQFVRSKQPLEAISFAFNTKTDGDRLVANRLFCPETVKTLKITFSRRKDSDIQFLNYFLVEASQVFPHVEKFLLYSEWIISNQIKIPAWDNIQNIALNCNTWSKIVLPTLRPTQKVNLYLIKRDGSKTFRPKSIARKDSVATVLNDLSIANVGQDHLYSFANYDQPSYRTFFLTGDVFKIAIKCHYLELIRAFYKMSMESVKDILIKQAITGGLKKGRELLAIIDEEPTYSNINLMSMSLPMRKKAFAVLCLSEAQRTIFPLYTTLAAIDAACNAKEQPLKNLSQRYSECEIVKYCEILLRTTNFAGFPHTEYIIKHYGQPIMDLPNAMYYFNIMNLHRIQGDGLNVLITRAFHRDRVLMEYLSDPITTKCYVIKNRVVCSTFKIYIILY